MMTVESLFIPFQRAIEKAKYLTHLKYMDEAEKQLSVFRNRLSSFEMGIKKSEGGLREKKRCLMTLSLTELSARALLEKEIFDLEKHISEAKENLLRSKTRYLELNQKFSRL
jgi:hypothetical protein